MQTVRMAEEWKAVKGYEGLYEVSNTGKVRSIDRVIVRKNGKAMKCKGKELFFTVSKVGIRSTKPRASVQLWKNGKAKLIYVHRLVAEAFIDNPNKYRCIDHIDGDKTNNNVSNLRWCSDFINQNNPVTRAKQRKTLKDKGSKFSPQRVVGIKADGIIIVYNTMCEAKHDGYSQSMISECCNGNRKHHKGMRWMRYSDYETLNQ